MKHLIFDTETTGLPNRFIEGYGRTHSANGQPRFIEIAWVLYDDSDGSMQEEDLYVLPDGFTVPEKITELTGITTQRLERDGSDEMEILRMFLRTARQADAIVGHNVQFDINVVTGRLADIGYPETAALLTAKPVTDTMRSSTNWCAIPARSGYGYKFPTLTELHTKLFGAAFEAHNALNDVQATIRCWRELQRQGII